jgi:alpha-N-arabinofuranosidase
VGGALITMMNNADRVQAACLAQLVNVIGPIMTDTGGAAWRQTIFHPFAQASRFGRGEVLRAKVEASSFSTKTHPNAPNLLATVVHDPQDGSLTLFALNRSDSEEMSLEMELRSFAGERKVAFASELKHSDLKAINTRTAPNEVSPREKRDVKLSNGTLRATLAPLSWNVISTTRT